MPLKYYIRIFAATLVVTLFLFFTSAYISMKLGAMPWPIVFSIVVSAGLLRLFSRQINRHDVNTAQAGGTIGGLMAAAVAFVLPGLFLLPPENLPATWIISLLAGTGGLLGVLLSDRVRHRYIDELALPYPAGRAGGELIQEGFDRGTLFTFVVLAGLLTGAFTFLRDQLDLYLIPVTIGSIVLSFLIAPMGVGAGYILGVRTGLNWLAGAVIGLAVLVPVGAAVVTRWQLSSDITPQIWAQNIGMGLVLGSGLAHLLFHGRLQGITDLVGRNRNQIPVATLSLLAVILLIVAGVTWWAALITLALTWLLVPVAAQLTGATNLDPLEQFGILTVTIVAGVYALFQLPLPETAKYLIAFLVAVTTAVAGDIGHDFKSAQVVGTPAARIVHADLFAVVAIIPAMPVLISIIRNTFAPTIFTAALPAPQAKLVYNAFAGLIHLPTFFGTIGAALLLEGLLRRLRHQRSGKHREPAVLLIPMGIGIFLGWPLSFVIALGGMIRAWVDRSHPDWVRAGIVLAAGIMGGEGIIGFFSATLTTTGMDLTLFRIVGIAALLLLAIGITVKRWRHR
ncbi:MAG: OPT/YSL family transporter [Fidelibacterota bacterium]|nr:MAG: OPT/YSL family transporter [Candidatus Neomarinimicrobiota bacterium]